MRFPHISYLLKINLTFLLFLTFYIVINYYNVYFLTLFPCKILPDASKSIVHHSEINYSLPFINERGNDTSLKMSHSYNLRNMGPATSNEELEFLLNIRKLITYSVYELNKPLRSAPCVNWWATPLDLISHEVLSLTKTHSIQKIIFKVQPGDFRFKVTISQKLLPIEITDNELEIVSSLEPLDVIPTTDLQDISYLNLRSKLEVRKTCIYYKSTEAMALENQTVERRLKWDLQDEELKTWPITSSFFIPDYLNYEDYTSFIISPGKNQLIQRDFRLDYCGPEVKLLVMISSAPVNAKKRDVIRQTYANPNYLRGKGVKVVFLMGIPKDHAINQAIINEAGIWQDIIQVNFVDSYHNLTLSHLSMYKWVHLTCGQENTRGISMPHHVLKADDDFLLNVELALRVAQNNSDVEFIGTLFCGTKPVRSVAYMTKYYTPRYMHISNSYAGYLSGVAYIIRTDVIPRLLHMSLTTPLIHMDDAYVTGILLRQLKIYPRSSPLITTGRPEPDSCRTKMTVSSCVLSPEDMMLQWAKFIEPVPIGCGLDNLQLRIPELTIGDKKACFFQ